MMSKRTVLLGMLICLTAGAAFGQPAVIAPNAGGDIGLFTMSTADGPRAGQFTLGFYGWYAPRVAGEYFAGDPVQVRYFNQFGGAASMGLGLTDWWSVFVSGGGQVTKSGGGWQQGVIDGIGIVGPFNISEGSKIRLGTKISIHSEADPDLRFAGWIAGHIPVGNTTIHTDSGNATDSVNSRHADWEWGGAVSKSWFTGMVSYTLAGIRDNDVRPPNLLRFGFGAEVPVVPLIHLIFESYYNVLDGGDRPEPDYATLNAGARIWFGHSGWALSAALNMNLNMLFDHGINPNPFGGILGLTYAAWPPAPPPPVVVPAPEAVVVEPPPPAPGAPAPRAEAPPPPRPAPRTTSDEIFFDGKSARLTNIAKAVLDGVALRMKNDLNATALIVGYTDNTGTEKANLDLGMKRAEAAKEYLVTRHGIDPGRIATAAKGAAEPAYDNATAEGKAKNRRATIIVTLVSGT
jgi:outer membrane protein OmpA-like peptidoglycan-associated protein